MRKLLKYISLAAITLMAACNDDRPTPQVDTPPSGVRIALALDTKMQGDTKAAVEDTYPMTAEMLSATIKQGDDVLHAYDKLSDIPTVLYLTPGQYTIALATNGQRSPVNEVPYYIGETPFTIAEGVVTSILAEAAIQSMAVSVTPTGDVDRLTSYKMSYYNLSNPDQILMVVTEQQNKPTPKRVYIDTPFPYGIRIEGRIDGVRWVKNVLVYDNLAKQTYHNISVN